MHPQQYLWQHARCGYRRWALGHYNGMNSRIYKRWFPLIHEGRKQHPERNAANAYQQAFWAVYATNILCWTATTSERVTRKQLFIMNCRLVLRSMPLRLRVFISPPPPLFPNWSVGAHVGIATGWNLDLNYSSPDSLYPIFPVFFCFHSINEVSSSLSETLQLWSKADA